MAKDAQKNHGIRIPPDLLADLRQLAQEDTRSLNGEVVAILRAYVEQRKQQKEMKPAEETPKA